MEIPVVFQVEWFPFKYFSQNLGKSSSCRNSQGQGGASVWGPRRDDTQREERGGQLGPPRSCWRCPALLVMEAGGDLAGGAGTKDRSLQVFPQTAGGRAGDPWGGHEAAPVHRLSRRVSDHRVPRQKGPRAPARSQGGRGRGLPPAGPQLVTAMGTGLEWGVGGALPAAGCGVTGSVPRDASHLWPLQRAWGRGTSERPQDQVRTGKLSLP